MDRMTREGRQAGQAGVVLALLFHVLNVLSNGTAGRLQYFCARAEEYQPPRKHWKEFIIEDAAKDIEELDVGDINDDQIDLPPDFPRSASPADSFRIDMDDEGDWAQTMGTHFGEHLLIVNLRLDGEFELYGDPDFTGAVLSKWVAMLKNAKADVRVYSVESARAIINLRNTADIGIVRRFLAQQPDVDYWTIDGNRFFPPGRSEPYLTEGERAKRIRAMYEGDPLFDNKKKDEL
ncbi:LDL receptor wingless signaling/trafficking chaperone [Toxoplasma gondii TgCatPRC2]|uniref:LDL receptor wingless signaling/trafficking chaperone n=1 Tax=Toxoplasma gondii TgCatPRC2 TaxID=1130821 RepID=A0A151HMC9_TOXGO|nr:LDL receptor wingless signaling/trafficking chaperone [Toxoplasma gondii TgCatPRC2]